MRINKILKKIGKFFLYFIGTIIALLAILILVIRINSSGSQNPFKDEAGNVLPNSIALKENKEINGVPQRLIIRGTDINNPVLLRVHGGPGASHDPGFAELSGTDLEDIFVVCYWDQRGSGPAYTTETPDSTITLVQIVDDGIAVSTYLKERFKKDKIYLEGYSWGTTVSAYMAQKRPDLFHAFIGIGQMGNQLLSEQLSYDFSFQKATEANDTVSIRILKAIGRPPYATNEEMIKAVKIYRPIGRKYMPRPQVNSKELNEPEEEGALASMMKLLMNDNISFKTKKGIFFKEELNSPGFRLIWPTCTNINLMRDVPDWQIPVYILQGEHDHSTEVSVAKAYFDSLNAPIKKWYTFEDAFHIPIFQDPQKYRAIMETEVLNRNK
jgi:pimeloyl-ACP methyl ester carboxylesterase